MSEFKDSQEYKDMLAKVEAATQKNVELTDSVLSAKNTMNDIKNDRDELKKQLKSASEKSTNEDASKDQLKTMIKDANARADKAEANVKLESKKSKIMNMARTKGFVEGAEKALFSYVDPATFTEDDNGELLGLDHHFDKLKENNSFLFQKVKKALPNVDADPHTFKGKDISSEAIQKSKNISEAVEVMKAREAKNAENNTGNFTPGMGNADLRLNP